ncbi:unnamed protein product [Symbiodinium natans]|uniref:Uncharacterized protein n=1 Tax=Symbiodinium natans TaxID=878477 RepID=A0A812M3M5_9DINO|nr:unnamed protein product [Symbiodinium natans]
MDRRTPPLVRSHLSSPNAESGGRFKVSRDELLGGDEEWQSRSAGSDEDSAAESFNTPDDHPLGENIYALLIAEVMQSYTKIWIAGASMLTVARLVYAALLMLAVIFLQVFLLQAVSSKLCVPAMRHIRQIYDNYQIAVYGENNTYVTVNGFHRGIDGAELHLQGFMALPLETKVEVCSVPLSQPHFTYCILLIWTMTCFAEIRATMRLFYFALVSIDTVDRVKDCIVEREEGHKAIVGVTQGVRYFMGITCFFPRIASTLFLNYLGCRWLVSTASLQDLFLNSLALEFMLLLPELIYRTFATDRAWKLTETIMIGGNSLQLPKEGTGLMVSLFWVVLAIVWVYVYMVYIQQVLPGYKWDVRHVCQQVPEIYDESA